MSLLSRKYCWRKTYECSRIYTENLFYTEKCELKYQKNYFSTRVKHSKIASRGIILLVIPIGSFFLGCWQVQRRKWKLNLMAELNDKTKSPPIAFPERLEDLENFEYRKVKMFGTFDHEKEIYLGPRTLVNNENLNGNTGIISSSHSGYNVITPFTLSQQKLTILVNRGWVPSKNIDPASRSDGQISGEVALTGIVRKPEKRAPFMPDDKKLNFNFLYRDVEKMAELTGSSPVFMDAVETLPGGPIGGQTRVTLRNEHLSYLLTWYSLSVATSFLWYRRFIKGKALM